MATILPIGAGKIKDDYLNIEANDNALNLEIEQMSASGPNALIGVFKGVDAVNTNDYAITVTDLTYFDGMRLNAEVYSKNTGAVTVNVNGLGAVGVIVIIDNVARELFPGEMVGINELQYNLALNKFIHLNVFKPTMKVYSVLDYGLVGGGAIDDSSALDDLSTLVGADGGGSIVFPKVTGGYLINTSVDIKSNIEIIGLEGAFIVSTVDVDIFDHSDDTLNENITIKNLDFEGYASGVSQAMIRLGSVDSITIRDCKLNNVSQGIYLVDCTNLDIEHNTITNGNRGVLVDGAATQFAKVEKNKINNIDTFGIKILRGDDIDIIGNECDLCGDTGIGLLGNVFFRVRVKNNTCTNNGASGSLNEGINIHGISDSEVSGNICNDNVGNGIDITGTPGALPDNRSVDTIVIDNHCRDNGAAGIVSFECENVLIEGNMLVGNYQNLSVKGANSKHITVNANTLLDTTDTVTRANLFVDNVEDVTITNNIIGERDSVVANNNSIYLAATIVGDVKIGYNNLAQSLNPKSVLILCDFDFLTVLGKQIYISEEITLSGANYAEIVPFLPTGNYTFLSKAYFYYTEASSADAGVTVGIGYRTTSEDRYAGATSEVSKAIGEFTQMTVNRRGRIDQNQDIYFRCLGGKTGTGKIRIIIEYSDFIPSSF